MQKTKIHFRSTRLKVNAGLDFPLCYAGAELLDLDKGRLPTTGDRDAVTCKHCLRLTADPHPQKAVPGGREGVTP